jgi:hypothetical protein
MAQGLRKQGSLALITPSDRQAFPQLLRRFAKSVVAAEFEAFVCTIDEQQSV